MSESELLKKLITKWHLSFPERRALPNQIAKVSILLHLIAEVVAEHGWYPHEWRPQQEFSGYLIELLPAGSCLVHHKAEVALMRYENLGSVKCKTTFDAARHWLQQMYPHHIDGVLFDWTQ